MDNKGFINNISARLGCGLSEAEKLTECFASLLREQCGEGSKVAIPGFGTFEGVKHDEEITTSLDTGKRMLLPPSVEVRFAAGGMLKKRVRGKEGRR